MEIMNACVHVCSVTTALRDPMTCSPPGSSVHGILSGCHALPQGIFPAQGSNLHFLHLLPWQVDSLPLNHLGSLMCKRVREKRQTGRLDRSREDFLWP